VSYGGQDPVLLRRVIAAVTGAGDAITFGRTAEGGAFYVGVLASGELEKFYLPSDEELVAELESIAEAGEALIQ
jgi:hypothetical protein